MLIIETIMSACSLLADIAIVMTMVYGIKAFRQDKRNVKADLEWKRKNETIIFSNEILEKTDNLLDAIKEQFGNETINVSDLQKEKNAELNQVIIKYLTLMERLSVGLNTEVYDLDVYARICCRKTIKTWKQLENIVEQRRRDLGSESLYKEFETVVNNLQGWKPKTPEETRGMYKQLK